MPEQVQAFENRFIGALRELMAQHDDISLPRLIAIINDEIDDILLRQQSSRKCDRCDECGGAATYANQTMMPINGRSVCVDWCIHRIVAALNAGGVETKSSCCGHLVRRGFIELADGRMLHVLFSGEADA